MTSPPKPTRDRASERILAGIGLVIVALACFSTLDTATKLSTASVPILMALWFRYAFQAVATTLVLLPAYGTALLRTAYPRFQLLRGALLLVSSTLAFLSLRYIPLAEFTSIVLLAPLARRLARVLAGAGRGVVDRNRAHRGLRRRRRLAHGARTARADRAGGVVGGKRAFQASAFRPLTALARAP